VKIEMLSPSELIPYKNNPRKNEQAIDKVATSISEFGFKQPIVVDKDNTIVVGHTRWKAALKLGLKEVPVIRATDLTPEQARSYRIADNKTNEFAEWDWEGLGLELDELKDLDIDLDWLEFDENNFPARINEGLTDDDAIPENVEPICKTGDLWKLGEHRLLCGDATKKEDVDRLMDGKKADMVFTDPPYGVNRDKGFGGERAFGGGMGKKIKSRVYDGEWDNETPPQEAFDNLLENSKEAIVWGGNFITDKLPVSGFWLVWDKHQTMPTFGDCELAWTNIPRKSVKKYDVVYNGLIGKEKERFHPTQKPVKLCVDVLSDLTEENALVLDLFGGSGSTLIACEQLNRICYMMELDPIYCDVIVKRWENFTGKKAELVNA